MPIYDYQCLDCDHVQEMILPPEDSDRFDCAECGGRKTMRRIISAAGIYVGNQDASWLKSVGEVLGDSPTERRFKEMPTRHNYRAMLRDRGLRPLEPGERTRPQSQDNTAKQVDLILKERQRRSGIAIYRPARERCE